MQSCKPIYSRPDARDWCADCVTQVNCNALEVQAAQRKEVGDQQRKNRKQECEVLPHFLLSVGIAKL
jgi:hypothetical protein